MKILITGSTGKLGWHLAQALADEGHELVLNYRNNKKTALALSSRCRDARIVQADVTNSLEVKKMFKKIGIVDVLINCVGNFIYKPLSKTSEQEFAECINSNLISAWNCAKSVWPIMRRQKFGQIINFGSAGCGSLTTRPLTTPYYIAKTGLLMLTRSLARELAGTGVTVNIISPGVLPHGVRPKGAPIISYREIINAVFFLIKNNNLTGTNIEASGGWKP